MWLNGSMDVRVRVDGSMYVWVGGGSTDVCAWVDARVDMYAGGCEVGWWMDGGTDGKGVWVEGQMGGGTDGGVGGSI